MSRVYSKPEGTDRYLAIMVQLQGTRPEGQPTSENSQSWSLYESALGLKNRDILDPIFNEPFVQGGQLEGVAGQSPGPKCCSLARRLALSKKGPWLPESGLCVVLWMLADLLRGLVPA